MLFNSEKFFIFFPAVVILFFFLPKKLQWLWLLLTSYFFYMNWNPAYAILIFISTLITFLSGIFIGKANDSQDTLEAKKRKKNRYVAMSIILNLGILFFFKYYDFFSQNIVEFSRWLGVEIQSKEFNILLPVGISFYTFQALGYTMDVYRGTIKPEKHFGVYALFVSFFPQLVAGPIERSANLLPQFKQLKKFDLERIKSGLKLMMWGYFQKVVIADRLAILVNTVYNDPYQYEGFQLILATIFFSFQIFCDFSAYSDIAIGAARVLGFDLMKNFDRPYFSKSIREFWRRWHISLSTWFRDYLYFPLGGNRAANLIVYRNILIVFIISGLWHGANWTFVIWGGLHGLYLVIEEAFRPVKEKLSKLNKIKTHNFSYKLVMVFINFTLVTFAWIFFRANSVQDSFYIIKNLFKANLSTIVGEKLFILGLDEYDFKVALAALIILILAHIVQRNISISYWINQQWMPIRWFFYIMLMTLLIIFGYYDKNEGAQFIYFQF